MKVEGPSTLRSGSGPEKGVQGACAARERESARERARERERERARASERDRERAREKARERERERRALHLGLLELPPRILPRGSRSTRGQKNSYF